MASGDEIQDRKGKHRSPAYPALDLETAIKKITMIYKAEKRAYTPVAVAAEVCGANITNSTGLRLIAALKQYGLLLEQGSKEDRQVKVSDIALDILLAESSTSPARVKAIRQSALLPPIHRKIWEKYEGELPSQANLRSYLLRELDFNDAHVERFIKTFFRTIEFAKIAQTDIIEDENSLPEDEGEDMETVLDRPRLEHKSPIVSDSTEGLLKPREGLKDFPLYTSNARGGMYVPASMSRVDFELLKQQIEAYLKVIEATSVQSGESTGE